MAKKVSNASENSFRTNEEDIYHLVWLNKNLKKPSDQQKLNQLRDIDEKIKAFTSEEQCIDYIQKHLASYIILIISDPFSTEIIPTIHDCKTLLTFFILCTNSQDFQHIKFAKLRAICTDINELMDRIRHSMERDKVLIDFSLFNSSNLN
jgi:hypothetical protein